MGHHVLTVCRGDWGTMYLRYVGETGAPCTYGLYGRLGHHVLTICRGDWGTMYLRSVGETGAPCTYDM